MVLNYIRLAILCCLSLPLAGCYSIGISTVAPREHKITFYKVKNSHSIHMHDNSECSICDLSQGDCPVFYSHYLNDTNRVAAYPEGAHVVPCMRIRSIEDVRKMLGEPASESTHTIRYNTNKRSWRGVTVNAAVFPVPLILLLVLPTLADGYIEFVFDDNGISHIIEYGTTSRFYGFWGDDSGNGFSWGSKRGFLF